MDSCKKNIPESNNMWYNAWKQTLYHRASGFCVHRRNPGAQFPEGVPCLKDMV